MAGFFKKLFNRIIGKTEEAKAPEPPPLPPPVEEPPAAPPAPTPESEPVAEAPIIEEVIAPEPAPLPPAEKRQKAVEVKPAPKTTAKVAAAAKKVEPAPEKPAPPRKVKAEPAPKAKPKPVAKAPPPPPAKPKAVAKTKVAPPPKAPPPKARKPEPALPLPPSAPESELRKEIVELTPPPAIEAPPVAPPPPPAPEPAPPEVVAAKVEPPPPEPPRPVEEDAPQRKGWFARLKEGLSKSSKSITGSIGAIFTKRKLDAKTLEELEDVLIQADLGLPMTERIIKAVSAGRYDKEVEPEEVKRILAAEVAKVLKPVETPFNFGSEKPFVILVVGVNGSGKTTTIGKLGAIATGEGFSVMLAACDTFRAAAIEQLTVWGQRIGAETMSRPPGSDASGLAFDALKTAREKGVDILIVDTAGRLQNKAYLMDELGKIVRVLKKQDATAPHAVLLVLDATVGQNAIGQAEAFSKVAGVTGIVMTKLDGTARGGILVAIAEKLKLPIHAIGVGETVDDLQPFDAEAFARAIAGLEDA
jgi:fused signal recognition particle receptor